MMLCYVEAQRLKVVTIKRLKALKLWPHGRMLKVSSIEHAINEKV